jgi:hypothetical protein
MKMKLTRLSPVLTTFICFSFTCFCTSAFAQTTIFADSFKSKVDTSGHPNLPSGWTTAGGSKKWVFTKDNADPSSKPPVLFSFCADANPSHGAIYGVSLDTTNTLTSPDLFAGKTTTGYTTIYVSWVEMFSPKWVANNNVGNSVAYSIDGTTWDTLPHTRNFVGNTYGITNGGKSIALPANAIGAAHLYLRWTFIPKMPVGNYAMSDVVITGSTHTSGINETIYASDNINAFYSNGNLNIHFINCNNGIAVMDLYTIEGKQVLTSTISTSEDKIINLNNIPGGVYIADFTINGQVYSIKFVR